MAFTSQELKLDEFDVALWVLDLSIPEQLAQVLTELGLATRDFYSYSEELRQIVK